VSVRIVRFTLKVVMENNGDFVDVICYNLQTTVLCVTDDVNITVCKLW